MISSEVQRTLVKSPPELWAELSDPAALARHLGELGDIRIVRTEPERTVEWAAENTTGTVSIKPSGWGTKVTLSVTREVAQSEAAPEAEATPALEAASAPEAEATPPPKAEVAPPPEAVTAPAPEAAPELRSEPEAATAPEPGSEPETAIAPDPQSETEPRRGFFARLFGRRRREVPSAAAVQTVTVGPADQPSQEEASDAPVAPDAFAAVREVLAPETFAAEHPFVAAPEIKEPDPTPIVAVPGPAGIGPEPMGTEPETTASEPEARAGSESTDGIAAELMAAEEAGAEEVTAVLTAVLDRLGAAHHRPFSRS
jgi:hypothetical protein